MAERIDFHTRLLASLFSRWETIVGEEIAQHAEPRSLRDGVLVLVVDQPAWAAQLRYLAADLLARLQVDVGPSEVAEIWCSLGSCFSLSSNW